MRPALATVLALVLAGCAAPGSGPLGLAGDAFADAEWYLKAVPFGEQHDHADPHQHLGLSTPNFEVVGWDPLVTDHYGSTVSGMGCGGVGTTAEGRRLALVQSISTDVAFVVADVTDPTKPTKIGEYYLPNVVVWDATITPDGKYAVVGANSMHRRTDYVLPVDGALPLVRTQPMFRDACTGETTEAGPEQYLPVAGVVLVSLEDPASPKLSDWVPQPYLGPHSVTAHEIDGTTWVTASITNFAQPASYFSFFEVADGRLVPLSTIQAPGLPLPEEASQRGVFATLNGHVDAYVAEHPGDGRVYAWLANWDQGVAVYDMSDPRFPEAVGAWRDGDAGSMHTVYPLPELRDGRHYTIAGQEVGEQEDLPSGWIYILDTTDPANPVELARWTLPVKPVEWTDFLQFSTHYVEVVGDTLFVTNYHGGMWAVDISVPEDPKTVGIFVPDRVSPAPYDGEMEGPGIEDVVAGPDGTLTLWDYAGGIYQVRFDASRPAPPAPAWPGSG